MDTFHQQVYVTLLSEAVDEFLLHLVQVVEGKLLGEIRRDLASGSPARPTYPAILCVVKRANNLTRYSLLRTALAGAKHIERIKNSNNSAQEKKRKMDRLECWFNAADQPRERAKGIGKLKEEWSQSLGITVRQVERYLEEIRSGMAK